MKILSLILIGLACISPNTICNAGGFFRRVPEVGEWARYHFVLRWNATTNKELNFVPDQYELPGSVEIKCVGEETIEDVRHLWIESRVDLTDYDGVEDWTVLKILVPADRVIEDDLIEHVVSAWGRLDELDLVSELDFNQFDRLNQDYLLAFLLSFPRGDTSVARRENKTLTIDGEEVQLSYNESGAATARRFEWMELSGEATWWPSAEHAFGVAAVEQHLEWTTEALFPVKVELHMDLAETGTDAVSELPDYN